jgi:hypothetical protein
MQNLFRIINGRFGRLPLPNSGYAREHVVQMLNHIAFLPDAAQRADSFLRRYKPQFPGEQVAHRHEGSDQPTDPEMSCW